MSQENINQEFRLKNIGETRNYFIQEINQNEFISKKRKIGCWVLHYTEHLLILVSTVTGCVSISAFASLVGISTGVTSSTVGLIIYVATPVIKGISQELRKEKDKMIK